MRAIRAIAALALLGLAGCAAWRAAPPPPQTWAGTLPCTDCPGVDHRLTLNRDGSYWLEFRYHAAPQAGDPPPQREVGRATLAHRRLALASDGAAPRHWALTADDALYPLRDADERVPRAPSATLARQPAADAAFGPLRVRGQLWRVGDRLAFEACATGLRHPLRGGDGLPALELELARLGAKPRTAVLVAIEARFHAAAAGPALVEVVAFERAVRDARCDGRPPAERG